MIGKVTYDSTADEIQTELEELVPYEEIGRQC